MDGRFLQSKPWLQAAHSGETFKEKREKRESASSIHALITPVFLSFVGVSVKREQIKNRLQLQDWSLLGRVLLLLQCRFHILPPVFAPRATVKSACAKHAPSSSLEPEKYSEVFFFYQSVLRIFFSKYKIRSFRGISQPCTRSDTSSVFGGPSACRSAGRAASGPQINGLTPWVHGTLRRLVFKPAGEIARPPHTERSGDGCLSPYQRICKAQTDLSNELWWVGVSLSLPNWNLASVGVRGLAEHRHIQYLYVTFISLHLNPLKNVDGNKRISKTCMQRWGLMSGF